MNIDIEQGILAYLKDELGATTRTLGEGDSTFDVLAFDLDGLTVSLHANLGKDLLPAHLCQIIVAVPNVPQIVPGLYQADINVVASSPIDMDGVDETTHAKLTAKVRACFPDIIRLIQRKALAQTEEAITEAQTALSDAHAKLMALGDHLNDWIISETNAWSIVNSRDLIVEEKKRWQFSLELKMAILAN